MFRMMKVNWLVLVAACVLSVGCEKSKESPPKATVVPEQEAAETAVPQPVSEPGGIPATEPVVEEETRSVGERVDHAIEATRNGLGVAGEKTREGVGVAAEKTGKALETAGEKTEEGVKKAAEATGGFLKKVGEKLEEAADRSSEEEATEP